MQSGCKIEATFVGLSRALHQRRYHKLEWRHGHYHETRPLLDYYGLHFVSWNFINCSSIQTFNQFSIKRHLCRLCLRTYCLPLQVMSVRSVHATLLAVIIFLISAILTCLTSLYHKQPRASFFSVFTDSFYPSYNGFMIRPKDTTMIKATNKTLLRSSGNAPYMSLWLYPSIYLHLPGEIILIAFQWARQ